MVADENENRAEYHNDDRDRTSQPPVGSELSRSTGVFSIIFLILAGLAAIEIYGLVQIHSVRDALQASQAQARTEIRSEMDGQVTAKIAALQNSNAQALNSLQAELDQTAQRMGSAGKQLKNARGMVSNLQKQEEERASRLKQDLSEQISQKADAQQVGALTEDVSAAKTDIDQTRKLVDDTRSNLGMTRSEFGTLIARNHDDIEQLRKLGDRDYFEFTLPRNVKQSVAGVGLMLKKTNVKRHRFNLNLLADDMVIEKKDRTINEPVFFSTASSKKFYELVVNQVDSQDVKGYLSTPKGAAAMAAERSEGGR